MRNYLLLSFALVTATISATSASSQSAAPKYQSVDEQRVRFDALYKNLGPTLNDALEGLNSIPDNPTAQQWISIKSVVLRENDLWMSFAELMKGSAQQAREISDPVEQKQFTIELARETKTYLPLVQREIALANEVIRKRPHTDRGHSLAQPSKGYVGPDDYPPVALRMNHEGRVAYRLTYSADGRATNCTVTASSGYTELDNTTCLLMVRRARFAPGRPGKYDGSISWRIPSTQAPAPVPPSYSEQPGTVRSGPAQSSAAYELGRAQAAAAMAAVHPH